MTWAEFKIRLYAYTRIKDKEEDLFREIAWSALIGTHVDPKKLPKSKQQYWPLVSDKKKKAVVTKKMRIAIQKAQEEYFIQKEKLKNG